MGLKGRLRRLEQAARSEGVILRLGDGGLRVFDQMEVAKEMFLVQMDMMLGKAHPSEVLDAVREATPESWAAFEQEHGSIEMVGHIIAADYQGGWVDEHRLLEDGTVETIHYEGGSEEAERMREEARQRGPAS
jgi:acylphosphatase